MLQIQITGDVLEFSFGMGEMNGFHLFRINTGPDSMSMPAAFLFMKDDGARLAAQIKAFFNLADGFFEMLGLNLFIGRRVKAQGEEVLFALDSPANSIGFLERLG